VQSRQSSKRPDCRYVRPGEMLAIKPEALHSGPEGFFWLFGGGSPANERHGSVSVVHVRGAMDHHADSWGENYESIISRVEEAMTGADAVEQHKRTQLEYRWEHGHEKDYRPLPDIAATPPKTVVLELDTPGGVVSGLNATVAKLQRMSSDAKIPLVAYVNEMAASAGFALACSCSKVIAPRSAIVGSIGVISTMASQYESDRENGLDYRLITSGARKADGHPHQPIEDAAVEAERSRVMKLAADFWSLASKARGIPVSKLRGLEAAIYLGKDAKRIGLVDEIQSRDEAIVALGGTVGGGTDETVAGGDETDRRAAAMLGIHVLRPSRVLRLR
jgi:ATP-dependent protease ClpP protease subunit